MPPTEHSQMRQSGDGTGTMHLAQINIGRLKYTRDDDRLAGWRDNVDRINALAEGHPGFIWRLTGAEGQETGRRYFDDERIVTNYSIWETFETFRSFAYGPEHRDFLRRRHEWFEPIDGHFAMWWSPAGVVPSMLTGRNKLHQLREFGPSQDAFRPQDRQFLRFDR